MKITTFNPSACQPPQTAEASALPGLLRSDDQLVWVNMHGPTPEDLQVMRNIFHFHPLAIEDASNLRQRPKIEAYPDHVFAILNTAAFRYEDIGFREIDLFIGENFIVTVHVGGEPLIIEAQKRAATLCTLQPMTTGYLAYIIFDTVIDSFFPIIDKIDLDLAHLEESIIRKPQRSLLARLFLMKSNLNELWRVMTNTRDMIGAIMREMHLFIKDDESLRLYLRDVQDHVLRIGDIIAIQREEIAGLIDLYMSSSSNRLAQKVNRLTAVTLGIGIMTVISGFYGMNFEQTFPAYNTPWGVSFVLLLMLIGIGIMLFVLHWLERE